MTTTSQPAAAQPPSELPPRPVPYSVLERGGHIEGVTGEQAVQDVVEVARTAEAHGYHRVWIAEHHAARKSASSFPAVLIAHIAALTERIRVGAGGVMLPNHPPFTVAEQFATLQALHPGRIDLGVGRSSGGTTEAHRLLEAALRRAPDASARFPEQVGELLGLLHDLGPDRNRFHALPLTPHPATPPEVHVLGASENSARLAAGRGLPFAYGHHLSRTICRPQAAARYRSEYRPGQSGAQPYLIVSVQVVCADTDKQAEALALRTASYIVAHSGATAPGAPLSPAREEHLARQSLDEYQVVHGGPATVTARLEALAAEFRADELMVVPYELTGAARCRTLRLTAAARRAPAPERRARG